MDVTKIQMSSLTSSMKLLDSGSGTATVPAVAGGDSGSVVITIAHGHTSDELIWEAGIINSLGQVFFTPFAPGAGSFFFVSYLDSTNLYIEAIRSPAVDTPAEQITYSYRIFIP